MMGMPRPVDVQPRLGARVAALGAVVFVTTLCLLPAYLFVAFAPAIKGDLALSSVAYGIAVTVFFGVSSLAATLTGRLADRLGSVAVLRVSLLPAAAALALVPLSHNAFGAATAMALGGLANALSAPACSHFLSTTVSDRRLGFAFGLRQAAVPLSSLVAGLAAAGLGELVGWRPVFLGGALCTLITIAAIRPLPTHTRPADDPGNLVNGSRTRSLAPLAFAGVLASAGSSITVAFIVISATDIGASATNAALLLALGSLASMVSRIETGRRATRSARSALLTASAVCAFGAVGALLLGSTVLALLVPATLLLFGGGTGWPGLVAYAAISANRGRPGRASGVMEASMNFGGAAGPLGFSILLANRGLVDAWLLPAAVFAGASIIVLTTTKGATRA